MLVFLSLFACESDYTLAHTSPPEAAAVYQRAVIDFYCEQTCERAADPSCAAWAETNWAYCLDGDELLDAGAAHACRVLLDAGGDVNPVTGCAYVPVACRVSSVLWPPRDQGVECSDPQPLLAD